MGEGTLLAKRRNNSGRCAKDDGRDRRRGNRYEMSDVRVPEGFSIPDSRNMYANNTNMYLGVSAAARRRIFRCNFRRIHLLVGVEALGVERVLGAAPGGKINKYACI